MMRRLAAIRRLSTFKRTLPLPQTEQERNRTMRPKLVPIDSVLSKKGFFDALHEPTEDTEESTEKIWKDFWAARAYSIKCKKEDPHLFFLSMGNVEMFRFMREMQAQGKLQQLFDEAASYHHEKWIARDIVNTERVDRLTNEAREEALASVRAERVEIAEALAKQHAEHEARVKNGEDVAAVEEEYEEEDDGENDDEDDKQEEDDYEDKAVKMRTAHMSKEDKVRFRQELLQRIKVELGPQSSQSPSSSSSSSAAS